MGVINDILTSADATMVSYTGNAFNAVSGPLTTALTAAGAVSLALFGFNAIFHVRSYTYSSYIIWFVRFGCIVAFATVWANFDQLRTIITITPLEYATGTIASVTETRNEQYVCGNTDFWSRVVLRQDPVYCDRSTTTVGNVVSGVSGMNEMFDQYLAKIFNVGSDLFDRLRMNPSTWKYIISGLIVYIIGLVFAMAAIFILLMAKIGLAVMFGIGPLAIAMLTFPATRGYFESWLRVTVGFALVPLISVSLMSVVLTVANQVGYGNDGFFAGNLNFVVVSIAALAFMFQVPHFASSLASTSLPQMGAGQMSGAAGRIAQIAAKPMAAGAAIASRISGGKAAAGSRGGGGQASANAGVKSMSQTSQYRADITRRKATGAIK